MPARALVFDFNGTLSDDEDVMEEVTADVLERYGRRPTHEEYVDCLAGLSDERVARAWLGDRPDIADVVAARVDGYRSRVSDGTTIGPEMRDVVRAAAARVPIAIVSGASRSEIEPIIRAAGIAELFTTVVTSDDVGEQGKPDPLGYRIALERLGDALPELTPAEVVVIEDTEAGIVAAKGAGMRCLGLVGTMPADRLGQADELVSRIDLALVERLLG
jgi:beta-phosphoglucomutase